jgi:hypothetical protein
MMIYPAGGYLGLYFPYRTGVAHITFMCAHLEIEAPELVWATSAAEVTLDETTAPTIAYAAMTSAVATLSRPRGAYVTLSIKEC